MASVGGLDNIPILGNILGGGPGGSSFGGGSGGGGLLGMFGMGGGFSQTPTERAMTDALGDAAANYGAQRPGLAQGFQNINSQVQNQFMPSQEALSMMYGATPRATNIPAPGGNPGGNATSSGGGSGGGGGLGGLLNFAVDPLGILPGGLKQTIFDPMGVTGAFGGKGGGGGLLGGLLGGGGGSGGGGLLGGLLGGGGKGGGGLLGGLL